MHYMKFTSLSVWFRGIQYTHTVVEPSLFSIYRTFTPSPVEELQLLNTPCPAGAPGNHHSVFRLCEFDYSKDLT